MKYVDYDERNRLTISLTVFPEKIGQVWKIPEIWDSGMGGIEKSDFSQILDPKWFKKLKGFVDSTT